MHRYFQGLRLGDFITKKEMIDETKRGVTLQLVDSSLLGQITAGASDHFPLATDKDKPSNTAPSTQLVPELAPFPQNKSPEVVLKRLEKKLRAIEVLKARSKKIELSDEQQMKLAQEPALRQQIEDVKASIAAQGANC